MGRSERTKRLNALAAAAEARERRHVALELDTPVAAAWLREHPQFPGAPARPAPPLPAEGIGWVPRSLDEVHAVLLRIDVAVEKGRQEHLAARRRQWERLHGDPLSDVPWT